MYSSTIDQKIILEYKKKTGLDYDKRSKIEVYTDIFKEDKKIKLAIGPYMFLSDDNKVLPLSGLSLIHI